MKALVFLAATPPQRPAPQVDAQPLPAAPAVRRFSFAWKQVKTAAARVPTFS
jgi:hypothetical protein